MWVESSYLEKMVENILYRVKKCVITVGMFLRDYLHTNKKQMVEVLNEKFETKSFTDKESVMKNSMHRRPCKNRLHNKPKRQQTQNHRNDLGMSS